MTPRGRPRKHRWFSLEELKREASLEAQYLKWASANNMSLQGIAAAGCPICGGNSVELRRDRKYKVVRFHCPNCRHETSYRIKLPKPGSFEIHPLYENGVKVGETIVDRYHPATIRQRSDAVVLKLTRDVASGRISLGGEWYVDPVLRGVHGQRRYYTSFDEVMLICDWNMMQAEHENRLRVLEDDCAV